MYDETPNKEYIDRWLEEMEARYRYENLKEMPLDRLTGMEFEVEKHFMFFKSEFPHAESDIQGELRAFLYDNRNEVKESLTTGEKTRLRQARADLKHEIYRARGFRKEKRREHRSDLMNSAVDFVRWTSQAIIGLWGTVKAATPW